MSTTRHAARVPLSQHTIGPFFPATFFGPGDDDLTRVARDAPATTLGEHILLCGRLTKAGGVPVVNGVIEIWQADAGGRFRHPADPGSREADPDFLGWGRAATDDDGQCRFRTVMPGGYVEAGRPRAPHVNVLIMGAGLMRPVRTALFFPGAPDANAADPVLGAMPSARRPRLVMSERGRDGGLRCFGFDIRLRGDRDEETPFFSD